MSAANRRRHSGRHRDARRHDNDLRPSRGDEVPGRWRHRMPRGINATSCGVSAPASPIAACPARPRAATGWPWAREVRCPGGTRTPLDHRAEHVDRRVGRRAPCPRRLACRLACRPVGRARGRHDDRPVGGAAGPGGARGAARGRLTAAYSLSRPARQVPGLGFELTEEQRALQALARKFAHDEIMPKARHCVVQGTSGAA